MLEIVAPMTRTRLLLLLLVLLGISIFAQSSLSVDELKARVEQAGTDSLKVIALDNLFSALYTTQFDEARKCNEQILELAEKIDSD